jgi:cold shock CspA family protein
MKIDFGIVKKYFSERGFGFVTHTFLSGHQSEVFFHVRNVKKTRSDLAEKLTNDEPLDTICFWYETENTSKGEQVRNVLKSDAIHNMDIDNLSSIIEKVEITWSDVNSMIPFWLRGVTVDLVGVDRAKEIDLERGALERERKELEEKRQKEREVLRETEEAKRKELLEEQKNQEIIEEKEFEQLVAEMKSLGITESRGVTWHIMNNRLGDKYKNISGVVQMEQDGTSWDFKGGFPKDIYKRLCRELGLSNQGTRARAVGFKAFKDL